MKDAVFEGENETAHDRAIGKLTKLLSMARVGCAASDSALDVDLSRDGFTAYFETMAAIADELFADLDKLQNKPERAK